MPHPIPTPNILWRKWTPEVHAEEADLANAVATFIATRPDTPAGQAVTEWLHNESLQNHGSTVTWLAVLDGVVQGYYAICPCQVMLTGSGRRRLGVSRSTQGAYLLAWFAKSQDCRVSGQELFLHALATARRLAESGGGVAIALDPYDPATADIWKAPPYEFREAKATPDGTTRLWRPLS